MNVVPQSVLLLVGVFLFPSPPCVLRVHPFLRASILLVHKLRVLVRGLACAGQDLAGPGSTAVAAGCSLPLKWSIIPNTVASRERVASQSWRFSMGSGTVASLCVVHDGLPIILPPTLVSFGF
ncbi:hypothetical protein VNO80_05944 [Phaseolus coccineus]|uniref:Secreted protein n=1 Tax=Phaseolus coccineus TaxID=3886 RepID=A0AAN9RH67_PHACN